MLRTRLAFSGMLLLLWALPAMAQPYIRGAPARIPPRPSLSIEPGYLGPRTPGVQYGFSYGFGSDYYSGYYYRPTPDFGYYYLGNYYPESATVTQRTPLSAPPPGIVPTPNLAGTSPTSPDYTFPDLINPASNPTIRLKQ